MTGSLVKGGWSGLESCLGGRKSPGSVPRSNADRIHERHHLSELGADLLELLLALGATRLVEFGAARLVLGDPALGERAVLDLLEDALHLGARFGADDARPRHVVAVFGCVADRVTHVVQA